MLRLYDPRTRQVDEVPPGPLRIHVHGGRERALVTADLLRRFAERTRRHVLTTRSDQLVTRAEPAELSIPEMAVVPSADVADGTIWVGPEAVPGRRCLIVPTERDDWDKLVEGAGTDALSVRLAVLREHYRDPDELDGDQVIEAAEDLAHWREAVAGWATGPGRPMDRGYAAEAEAALSDDLDSPTALAVLDRLTADPGVEPGAKLETFIHLDLILGLDLVAAIGRGV